MNTQLVPMQVRPYGYWRVSATVRDTVNGGGAFLYSQTFMGYPKSQVTRLFEEHLSEKGLVLEDD